MKTPLILLLLVTAAGFPGLTGNPAQALYDTAVRDEAHGRFGHARRELVKLGDAYPASPLAYRARNEISALDLFLDARQRQQAGQTGTAFVTYRTVAQVYPESPLAKRAEATSRELETQRDSRLVVRSISYRAFGSISADDVRAWFAGREVPLAVERAYDAQEVERARVALVELLKGRGLPDMDVKVETEAIPPHSIGITFTASKK